MCVNVLAVFQPHNVIGLTFNLLFAVEKCFEPQLHYLTLMSPRCSLPLKQPHMTLHMKICFHCFFSSAAWLLTHGNDTKVFFFFFRRKIRDIWLSRHLFICLNYGSNGSNLFQRQMLLKLVKKSYLKCKPQSSLLCYAFRVQIEVNWKKKMSWLNSAFKFHTVQITCKD